MKGDKTKHFPSQILNINNLTTNFLINCQCFNSFIANLGTNLSKSISSSTDKFNYVIFSIIPFFTSTNQFEIESIINNLKITRQGYDDIHPKIIKQISMIIAMPLGHILEKIKIRDFYVLFLRKAHSIEHPLRGCPHLVLISQLSRLKQCG